MEPYAIQRDKALGLLKAADHMLTMTYPLIDDPKLLVNVLENLFLASVSAVTALLEYERKYKRIPALEESYASKMFLFRMYTIKKYGISKEYLSFIESLKELLKEYKDSTISFSRKKDYIIANKNYELKKLSFKEMKKNLEKAKLFIHNICSIIEENERVP